MLKRGKNRLSHVVRASQLESLAKTFGRSTAIARARCPFPSCRSEPAPLFCAEHWTCLDGVMRRELLTELRVMKDRGQRDATPRLRGLFTQAIEEIQVVLYKRAAKPAAPAAPRVTLK
jgi:hypothetical protein